MTNLKIAVVGLPGAWSTEQLADAIEEKTGHRQVVDISQVTLNTEDGKVYHNGDDLSLCNAIIIKKVGAEYSPNLLDRLEILRYLEKQGVKIFSRPEKILRLLDRLSCTITLAANKVPMPPTIITEELDKAVEAVEKFGEVVLKPLYSTKARGMLLLSPGKNLLEQLKTFQSDGNQFFYLQKKLELPGRDMGVVFLGGRFLKAYARIAGEGSWNTTIHSGGRYEPCEPSDEILRIAQHAQSLFGLDFTCVDVVETDEGPKVFEVSAFGGFKGLQKACGIDAAELLVEYVIEQMVEDDKL